MIKFTFIEWLFLLKAQEKAKQLFIPVIKYELANEQLKKNPNFHFLLETEAKN